MKRRLVPIFALALLGLPAMGKGNTIQFIDHVQKVRWNSKAGSYRIEFRRRAGIYYAPEKNALIECLTNSISQGLPVQIEADGLKMFVLTCGKAKEK